jgi:hypothetical protein
MLSPSSASAYSEPPNPSYPPMFYKPPVDTELPLYEKDETANNGLEHEQQIAMQQQHPHIPSLMSMHPNLTSPPLPLHMFTYPQQPYAYAPQYQEAYYQYQVCLFHIHIEFKLIILFILQPMPMVSPTNPPPHLNQFNGMKVGGLYTVYNTDKIIRHIQVLLSATKTTIRSTNRSLISRRPLCSRIRCWRKM